MAEKKSDSDIHIKFEDQQKINKFARSNAKYDDIKIELKAVENELKNLEDAATEIFSIDEEDQDKIPYLFGEVFFSLPFDQVQENIDIAQESIKKEVSEFNSSLCDLKDTMDQLKTHLYAKFGNSINLEADDS